MNLFIIRWLWFQRSYDIFDAVDDYSANNPNSEPSSCIGDVTECPFGTLIKKTKELKELAEEYTGKLLNQVQQSSEYFNTVEVRAKIRDELLKPAAEKCIRKDTPPKIWMILRRTDCAESQVNVRKNIMSIKYK